MNRAHGRKIETPIFESQGENNSDEESFSNYQEITNNLKTDNSTNIANKNTQRPKFKSKKEARNHIARSKGIFKLLKSNQI